MAGRGAQSDHKLSTINEEHADDLLAKVNEFEKLVNPENEEQVKVRMYCLLINFCLAAVVLFGPSASEFQYLHRFGLFHSY
jgi:hypothetical protein